VKASRGAGGRFKLIDTGKLSSSELEWLGEAGADFYTSDRARPDGRDLGLMNAAARKGSAVTAYFHHGPLEPEEKEKAVSFATLKELGRNGLYIYTSNGRIQRDFPALEELAYACIRGGSRLAFYHHGPFAPALETLARQGAWIHIAGQSLHRDDDTILLCDCARAARERAGGVWKMTRAPASKICSSAGLNGFSSIRARSTFIQGSCFKMSNNFTAQPIGGQKRFFYHRLYFFSKKVLTISENDI